MTTVNTIQQLIDLLDQVDQDATVLASIANDSATEIGSGSGPGLVTTRLGNSVKNVQKVIADIESAGGATSRPDIQDDGLDILVSPDTLNFVGSNITVTDIGGVATIAVTGGSGDVVASGTPADNQLAVWTSSFEAEGDSNLTWDGTALSITGNIAVSGTVDGRDLATDGTKLDGIESNATADQTGAEIVSAIDTELGNTDWQTGGGSSDVVNDTTPQLGGNLDVNGNSIVSVSNGDVAIVPNGTGNVLLGNFEFDVDQTVGAGQDNYVLTYDNSTGHISLEETQATVTTQTEITGTTYTTLEADFAGDVLRKVNDASGTTITVAAGLSNNEPCTFIQTGSGQITFAEDVGVTINSADGNLLTRARYSSATLIPDKAVADTFYLIGDLTT